MKNRFTTLDIVSIVPELHRMLKGYRVHQVYDVDAKTYLIKLKDNPNEETPEINKLVLLIESGIRLHVSEYNWPKHSGISGFTLKLRKHLRNKRIEYIKQVGIDRVVDIQFGINEAAYHIIIELYDKGNVIITDHQYVILNLLRSRKPGENDDVKIMVREVYPLQTAIKDYQLPNKSEIISLVQSASPGDTLRKIFNPRLIFGTALLEHCFMEVGFPENWKLDSTKNADYDKIEEALKMASNLLEVIVENSKGIIIHKEEISQATTTSGDRPKSTLSGNGEVNGPKTVITYTEFHPMLFNQHATSTKLKYIEFDSFGKAVDIYFSSIEGQKIDTRALQQEKEALKKLENVKKDHEKRLVELANLQEADKRKASLIEMNKDLVEKALLIMRSAIANQISWEEIKALIKEAQLRDDVVACSIKGLKLEKNQFTMLLVDPFDEDETNRLKDLVDIDLDLSAFANARRYYDQKRYAAKKTQKTLESSSKALKSAEHRTQQALKEVAIKTSITKARKVLWFEKFFWFISSENYLVIGGRDAQQNELIVKKYLTQGDIYVHADLHGASSIVIKNYIPGEPIPPKTLTEAGIMAVAYSNAWENKFSSRSWWVHSHQVSKTAPSGEYLTVGAFMIRGKKNYLPMAQLVMGFGFVFRLDEESIERHKLIDRRSTLTSESGDVESNSKLRDSITEEDSINTTTNNSEEDVDDEDRDEDNTFPDIKIKNITQTINKSDDNDGDLYGERDNNNKNNKEEVQEEEEGGEQVAITGSQVPRMKFQAKMKKKRNEGKKVSTKQTTIQQSQPQQQQQSNQQQVKDKNNKNQPLKRGQRYKLKKKEKYKDQDEEDKLFKLAWIGSTQINRKMEDPGQLDNSGKKQLYQGDGVNKDHQHNDGEQSSIVIIGRAGGDNNNEVAGVGDDLEKEEGERDEKVNEEKEKEEITITTSITTTTTTSTSAAVVEDEEEDDDDDEQKQHQDDEEEDEEDEGSSNKMIEHVNLMNSLTGQPMADDILLYTIPVVAPYSALSSYKFKVKVFPGTSKRGKSAKTALTWFQADKTITQREKDLLKNAKDQDISRNLPNKVKILPIKLNTTVRRKGK